MPNYWPTDSYPGVYWPTSRQVEAQLPVMAAPPFVDRLSASNLSASGIQETIITRQEERRLLTFFGLDALEVDQWRQYFTERGGRGQQAEMLVDRFTGCSFTFANTVADQNSEPVSAYAATPSYQMVLGKIGLVAPASRAAVMFSQNVGSVNAAIVNSAGAVLMTVVCSFAGNDGLAHTFWHAGNVAAGQGVFVQKTSGNQLIFSIQDSAGVGTTVTLSGTFSWPSGTIITAIAKWTVGQSLGLQVVMSGSAIRDGAASLPGVILGFANTHRVAIGAGVDDINPLTRAVLLAFATYRTAYDDPTILTSHFPLGRNYYSRAEVIERTFAPTRIAPSVDAWQWTWTFRQGFSL